MARSDARTVTPAKRARDALNPYAAPAETPAFDFRTAAVPREHRLATINQRFAAHFVDVLVFLLPPFLVAMWLFPSTREAAERSIALVALALLVPALLQWFLIANYGQTIGKRLFKTRIVRVDGSPVGFFHGVVLRSWVGCLPALVPIAGYAYVIVDSMYVFRRDRRTLRDRIARTLVVRA
jgi:uncharacterized RDD family membrane protein YckC